MLPMLIFVGLTISQLKKFKVHQIPEATSVSCEIKDSGNCHLHCYTSMIKNPNPSPPSHFPPLLRPLEHFY